MADSKRIVEWAVEFYERLPDVGGFGVEQRVDLLGAALALGATAGVVAHAAATGIHQARERKRQLPVVEPPPGGSPPSNA